MRLHERARLAAAAVALGAIAFGCGAESGDPLTQALDAHAEGDVDSAQRLYRDVLSSDPTNKFAHYNLGLIAQTNGDGASAIASYRQALAADGRFVPALFNLAILLTGSKPTEAIHLYRKVIDLQPKYAAAHLNLGFALKANGATSEGEKELRKALELDPELESRVGASPAPRGRATPTP